MMALNNKLIKIKKDTILKNAIYKAAMSSAKKHEDPLYTKYLYYMNKAKEIRERIKTKYEKKVARDVKKRLLT